MSDGRELGALFARLEAVEDEVDKLRDAKHQHSNRITALTHVPMLLKEHNKRIDDLEAWHDRWRGVAVTTGAIMGALGGALMSYIMNAVV